MGHDTPGRDHQPFLLQWNPADWPVHEVRAMIDEGWSFNSYKTAKPGYDVYIRRSGPDGPASSCATASPASPSRDRPSGATPCAPARCSRSRSPPTWTVSRWCLKPSFSRPTLTRTGTTSRPTSASARKRRCGSAPSQTRRSSALRLPSLLKSTARPAGSAAA